MNPGFDWSGRNFHPPTDLVVAIITKGPVSYRRVMQLQVQRYKRSLLSSNPYVAFRRVN